MSFRLSLVLVLMFILLVIPSCVYANGMPLQYSGEETGVLYPLQEENIAILQEDLRIEFTLNKRDMISDPQVRAAVDVMYNLLNRSEGSQMVTVAFPSANYAEDWQIVLNGEPLEILEVSTVSARAIRAANTQEWIDPYTGRSYIPARLLNRRNSGSIPAVIFELPLEPGEHKLTVTYQAGTGSDTASRLNPIHSYDYLLRPAASWADFKNLTITVTIPYPHRLSSSLPLKRLNHHTWQGEFSKLPEENLQLFFTSTEGTWGGMVKTDGSAFLMLLLILTLMVVLRKIGFKKLIPQFSFTIHLIASLFLSWVSYVTFNRQLLPYPFTILQYPLFWGVLSWLFIPLVQQIREKTVHA